MIYLNRMIEHRLVYFFMYISFAFLTLFPTQEKKISKQEFITAILILVYIY